MLKRIRLVAAREFVAIVANRAFVIGLLIVPAIIAIGALVAPVMLALGSAADDRGEVAIIDRSGEVVDDIRDSLSRDAVANRLAAEMQDGMAPVREIGGRFGFDLERILRDRLEESIPSIELMERPADADIAREKAWVVEPSTASPRLALIVVHADAIVLQSGQREYGGYDLYLPPRSHPRTEELLHEAVRDAIASARVEAARLDRERLEALLEVARGRSITVDLAGDREAPGDIAAALPIALAAFLVIGVGISGQMLLASTVEEKSSRTIEVLLAAVSPFELLAGKLLGQLAVSLLVFGLVAGAGLAVLTALALAGVLDWSLLVYLLLFFLITYLVFGALFAAVGAAVSDVNEAESLSRPMMILLIAPWVLVWPLSQDPTSTLATVLSFTPPVNMFVMMMRLASSLPPPAWQVWLTMGIGCATALAAIWFAAKIFKVALLLHGRPPNLATLVRWARAA